MTNLQVAEDPRRAVEESGFEGQCEAADLRARIEMRAEDQPGDVGMAGDVTDRDGRRQPACVTRNAKSAHQLTHNT